MYNGMSLGASATTPPNKAIEHAGMQRGPRMPRAGRLRRLGRRLMKSERRRAQQQKTDQEQD